MEKRRARESGAPGKKPYEPPRLVRYGTIKELTTGGSSNANEASQGQTKRP